jgi:hypothetical protein
MRGGWCVALAVWSGQLLARASHAVLGPLTSATLQGDITRPPPAPVLCTGQLQRSQATAFAARLLAREGGGKCGRWP